MAKDLARSSSTPVARLCAELLWGVSNGTTGGGRIAYAGTSSGSPSLLLDDGTFFMFSDGALWRRCEVSRDSPRGRRCVGMFFSAGSGWSARIARPYDATTQRDFETVLADVDRLDAIAALWRARSRAHE